MADRGVVLMMSPKEDSTRCTEGRPWPEGISGGKAKVRTQGRVSDTATKAISPVPGAAGYRSAVNQFSKSVVREIRTLRSVGAGGGQPPLATRYWR